MYYYAQLDTEGICTGVSQLSAAVMADGLIPISAANPELVGKRYTASGFVDVPKEPLPEPLPSDTELMMQTLADQELLLLDAQQGQQFLAQHLTDLELYWMGGMTNV